jgi:hypothetical protein
LKGCSAELEEEEEEKGGDGWYMAVNERTF